MTRNKNVYIRMVVILFFLLIQVRVLIYAGDGQIDILPNGSKSFKIGNPGSYVLTDNVTMSADVDCISLGADSVTIDLNGHVINGTGSGMFLSLMLKHIIILKS